MVYASKVWWKYKQDSYIRIYIKYKRDTCICIYIKYKRDTCIRIYIKYKRNTRILKVCENQKSRVGLGTRNFFGIGTNTWKFRDSRKNQDSRKSLDFGKDWEQT